MPKFNVDYEVSIPEWGTITVEALDKDEAHALGETQIETLYPEMRDFEITEVKEIG